jgi:hypothetical protein
MENPDKIFASINLKPRPEVLATGLGVVLVSRDSTFAGRVLKTLITRNCLWRF